MEFARTEERFAPIMRNGDDQTMADARPHVSAGITAGLLRGEDPEVLTMAILGVTAHLARELVLGQGRDADRVAEAAIAFCRQGIWPTARLSPGGSHEQDIPVIEAQPFVDGLRFGECPRWHEGRLWYVDFYEGTVSSAGPGGDTQVEVDVPGEPAGLGWRVPTVGSWSGCRVPYRAPVATPDGRLVVHGD